jgi:hypothetical protein
MQQSTKSKAPELRDWSSTKDRIGQQLKAMYQMCMTEELPPRLLELMKKLDEETEPAEQPEIIRDIEN